MTQYQDIKDTLVIAPNFKRRVTGVTSSIIQLVPLQRKLGTKIASLGLGLPDHVTKLPFSSLLKLWRKPKNANFRVWHARRNIEMLPGIILRDIFRCKLKLIFTSSSQRKHGSYTKWLVSKMDKVIATRPRENFFAKRPFTVVMHGIDLERFEPSDNKALSREKLGLPSDKNIVGCFGRIRHKKGTDQFVQAMISLLPSHPDWVAIIIGRATSKHKNFEADLKSKIATAGLENQILFLGEHNQIENWYQALDLYVTPSHYEGFGLTPFEAAACAVPTVATNVGAFKNLILLGETGEIVRIQDQPALEEAIEPYLSNPKLCKDHGVMARKRMEEKFSLEIEARALNKIYNELAELHE